MNNSANNSSSDSPGIAGTILLIGGGTIMISGH